MTRHQIRFEDATQGTVQVRESTEVPESIAVVGGVPVVRVVSELRGEQRVILSYAADGRLLESTVQRPR